MHYQLTVYLYEEGTLEDLLTALASLGVENAIVVDGQRMSRLLAFDVPIFAGFREEAAERSAYCKIISAVVDRPGVVDGLLKTLKEADMDFEKEGLGVILLTPVERCVGGAGNWL